ncbi:MAG: hypothetical protein GY938_16985 [Ketobacter sp.]|nr:hypothetical protein [Ketobacter sp.]
MADTIEINGKEYIEIGYLIAANKTAKRRGDKINHLRSALTAADGIRTQLGYFMECDSCENDPNFSWPDCDCEGCAYCSASEDMNAYDVARAATS